MVITIDGLGVNGKSTLAGMISKKLGYKNFNTGAIYSTKWATISEIKEFVRNFQKEFIAKNDTVMEGRDIATRIAPNAEFKFYLYSDFEIRVKRLWNQLRKIDIDTIRNDLKVRDDLDINCGNFIKPINAIEIDTTNLSIEEVYEIMINKIIS
jgi:cytidylate kinase